MKLTRYYEVYASFLLLCVSFQLAISDDINELEGIKDSFEGVGSKTNFVIIIADDLGQQDLAIYQTNKTGEYRTPNIDRLAAKSIQFDHAYSTHPRCIPARVSLLTGKYPARFDVPDDIDFRYRSKYFTFDPGQLTFGEAFQRGGYDTTFIGKWHLSNPKNLWDKTWPWDQGFNRTYGISVKGNQGNYFSPYTKDGYDLINFKPDPEGTYLTDQLTDVTNSVLTRVKDDPFLVVLSHYAVHLPLQAPQKEIDEYQSLPTYNKEYIANVENNEFTKKYRNNAVYAAMVTSFDRSVGRVMDKLEELGLSENTIVILTSDNGGLSTSSYKKINLMKEWKRNRNARKLPTSNSPLRAGKGWLYEGGIRVPMLIRAPGIKPRSHSCPVTIADIYPTMLDMAGLPLLPEQHKDGNSLKCLLGHKQTPKTCREKLWRRRLFWHQGDTWGIKTTGNPRKSAMRINKWKIIENLDTGEVELYDVLSDTEEIYDHSKKKPWLTKKMLNELATMRSLIQGKS